MADREPRCDTPSFGHRMRHLPRVAARGGREWASVEQSARSILAVLGGAAGVGLLVGAFARSDRSGQSPW